MAAQETTDGDAGRVPAGGDAAGHEHLTVAQVARRLGCSVSLVQKWRRLGWLPAVQLGPPDLPVYGYRPADVEEFAATRWNRRRGRPPKAGSPQSKAASSTRPAGRRNPAAPATSATASASSVPAASSAAGTPARQSGPPAAVTAAVPTESAEPAVPGDQPGRWQRVTQLAGAGPAGAAPPEAEQRALETEQPAAGTGQPAARQQANAQRAAAPGRAGAPSPSPAPPSSPTPVAPPTLPGATGRPLVLWDGDPRAQRVLVLARFGAGDVETALRVAELWSRRYGELALGEAAPPRQTPNVLLRWRNGQRVAP